MCEKITIVTAALNCADIIDGLIDSLNSQTSKKFIWLIVDGSRDESTVNRVAERSNVSYSIIKSRDFSIYHALNIGVAALTTRYYLVAGSDDRLAPDLIERLDSILQSSEPGFLFGEVRVGGQHIHRPSVKLRFDYGTNAAHAVGTLIDSRLHEKYGLYSNRFPVVADKYFIKRALMNGERALVLNCEFGYYSQYGFSSLNKVDYVIDLFKMQIKTGESLFLQLMLLLARLLKLRIASRNRFT